MVPIINSVSSVDTGVERVGSEKYVDEAALRQAAIDFEATYIAQMLTFSGLDKALLAGGGEDMSAFTSFYIQSFAQNIAENGGFGLSESFYKQMALQSEGLSTSNESELNVELGKL